MIQKLPQSSGNVIGFAVRGDVNEEDYTLFDSEMKSLIAQHGKVNMLISLKDMSGIDLDALDDDLRMSKYLSDVERTAVVSDSRFYDWMTSAGNAIMGVEMRRFEPGQEEQAWAWLR